MRDRGLRKVVAVLAGLAVIYFGSRGSGAEGGGVSRGVIVLAVLAAALVWYLTRPRGGTTP